MDSLQNMTTAKEYIDYYYTQLKNELNARGLQVSKVGVIGLLLHILGFTQQDVKQYFDTLFREAFVGTADKFENLVMHGSIFGYFPQLATPSSITGYFELNFKSLPIASDDTNRSILLEKIKVSVGKIPFILDSKYVITGNICQITDSSGKITNIPFSLANPKIPIVDMNQYEEQDSTFTVPFYVFGSYFSRIVELERREIEPTVSQFQVFIKERGSDTYEEYETRLVDYFTGADEKVVFVKYLPNNKVVLELGSGIHGKYVPGCTVKIIAKTTVGELGNISQQTAVPLGGTARVYDQSVSSGLQKGSYEIDPSSLLTVSIDYADGGVNALNGKELREAIISFIRSRDSLMSEQDFYDILKKYIPDFLFIFKKTHIMDNVMYCFVPYRDKYQTPLKGMSLSVKHPVFNPKGTCYVYRPTFVVDGVTYISPFLYVVDYLMRYYKGYLVWEKLHMYFSNVVNEKADPTTGEIPAEYLKSLPLTLYVLYNPVNDNTRFIIQSYQALKEYVFYISIPLLGITDICMTSITDTLQDYYYYNNGSGTGIIFETIDISIKAFRNGEHVYTYNLNDFSMTNDISDLLTLKTFDGFVYDLIPDPSEVSDSNSTSNVNLMFSADSYVLNIPIMRLDDFNTNEEYYIQKFADTFATLSFDNNRMISDDVQIRFTNTDYIDAAMLSKVTKQGLNHQLNLPLHLDITIAAYKDKINEENINTATEEFNLKLLLAQKLHDSYSGHNISFYKTQIIDIVHNLSWVKYCDVRVWDAKKREISNANIETNSQEDIVNSLDKLGAVSYCPMYFWWDLDNITVKITFE